MLSNKSDLFVEISEEQQEVVAGGSGFLVYDTGKYLNKMTAGNYIRNVGPHGVFTAANVYTGKIASFGKLKIKAFA